MNAPDGIVVYRSHAEKAAAEWWWDFFVSHPWVLEAVAWLGLAGVLAFIAFQVWERGRR